MVAHGAAAPTSVPLTPNPVVRQLGYGAVRFTLSDALEMVDQGILPEDATVELLDGTLIYRDRFDLRGSEIVEGVKHSYVIAALAQLSTRIDNDQRHLRTQCTLVCSETHAPIPDACVLRGTLKTYCDRLATAEDAWCVIEVADSSYERDTGEKLQGYARAGVEQYVVINLRNRTAEVYTLPDRDGGTYPPPIVVPDGERVGLRVGAGEALEIALSEILPALKKT